VETPDARDAALPCRPTISCTADITAPGTLETELGFQAAKGDFTYTRNFPLLFKLTITKLLQLQLGSNGATFTLPARNLFFDNLLVGAKLHVQDQTKYGPSFAVTGLVGIPLSNVNGLEAYVTGHASKDIGPIHADLNAGIAETTLDTTPVSQPFVAFALSTTVVSKLVGVALETYYFADSPPTAPHDGGVRFALTLTPKPWLVFDAGGDVGFFPSVRAFSAFFGMTVIPAIFWRR
jgi:hypothetical protein